MRKIEDWVFFENIFHNFSIQRSPNLIRKSHPFFYPKLFNHLANFKTYATYQNRYCQKFQIWEMIEYSFHLEYFISDWFQKQNLLFRQNVNHLKMELPWLKWGFGEFLKHINSQKVETTQMAINRRRDKQNVVYTYNGILFSHKKEWNSSTCSIWINLENILLSKISQTQKYKYYMTLLIWGIQNRQIHRDRKYNCHY